MSEPYTGSIDPELPRGRQFEAAMQSSTELDTPELADGESTGLHVLDMLQMENIADQLSDAVLLKIGNRVVDEADIDFETMKPWLKMNEMAAKLIEQDYELKSEPWEGASNTKLPLVLDAIMRAHAEEMPEIIRDDELVRAKVFGRVTPEKTDRAERVTARLNYQLFYGMETWEADHDKMTLHKNNLGTVHKKTYWCAEEGRYRSDLKIAGVIINDNVEHLQEAFRVTDTVTLPWWQVEEKVRAGSWRRLTKNTSDGRMEGEADTDKIHTFYEQIRREDLDGDGYPEPYVVTVHKASKQVVRITANYTPEAVWFKEPPQKPGDRPPVVRIDQTMGRVHYTKYEMIPSLSGGYWGWGFGRILGPMNENCNALVNQLIDAGTLSNTGGGFLSSALRMGKGRVSFSPGEYKTVNAVGAVLKDSIVTLPVRDPSPTLFNLLGLLMEVLRQSSGITQLMSGEQPKANAPASSTLALLEQGRKAFGQVYKRHRRALKAEILALFKLCYLYEDPEEYAAFFDMPEQDEQGQPIPPPDPKSDFELRGMDLQPTAQPEFSTQVQRIAQSEALMKVSGDPRVNGSVILKMYVQNVLNNREMAEQIVPVEPNITPEQQLQNMEMAKKQILDQLDVQKAQFEAETAQLNLEIKRLDAQVKGVTGPMQVTKAEHAAIRSAQQVEQTGIQLEIAGANLELVKAKIANEEDSDAGNQD